MKAEFTAIVKKDGDWWIGWVEEIPGANAQERTRDELMVSLTEAARDILDVQHRESIKQMQKGFEAIPLAL
ncbi:MAG: type II toxin-antitoxin system HicB family antitoxin [Gammaproteobacteria bacterium]|nr:type II toxin-antitoxin system HicB family antitoxin [Gammaproteobacteria bacterium]